MPSVVSEVRSDREIHEEVVTETVLSISNECVEPVKLAFIPVVSFDHRPSSHLFE